MTPQHRPAPAAGRLAADLTFERLADHTVIAISGELDVSTTPFLRERLYVALRDLGAYVVIDLSDVTFCDASGLAVLVGARRRTEATGSTLVLARPRPHLVKLLQVTGLSRVFTVRPSLTAARSAAVGTRTTAA